MQVDFLHDDDLEASTHDILQVYQKKKGTIADRVPLELIAVGSLGLSIESFDDGYLPNGYGEQVIGLANFDKRIIATHESILPETSGNEGRYNFTLAHEIGHFVLHEPYVKAYKGQLDCFEKPASCLAKTTRPTRPRIEIQADHFASFLLMPTNLVLHNWNKHTGRYKALSYQEIRDKLTANQMIGKTHEQQMRLFIKPMAEKMGASSQALLIRLKDLGLITQYEQYEF